MPTVASYCTVFLKPEMLHVYRQVTSLRRFQNLVITKTRQHEKDFPFKSVIQLTKPRNNLLKRLISKYFRKKSAFIYRGEYAVLESALKTQPIDLLHVYFGHTGVHLLPFLERTEIPWLVSFHGADVMPREDRPGYLEQLRKLLKIIPLALARSESLADRLVSLGCDRQKIRINRTGIPLEHYSFNDRSSRFSSPLRLIQACRLIAKKGIATTIEAFAIVRREFPGCTLVIAGEGPLKDELSSLVARLGLAAYVQFVGFLDQDALRTWYQNSDIFIHPSEITERSDQEGVPNSMLEAMATGLPVLATLHGGIPEAVDSGRSGILVAEKDVEALAEAIRTLGIDPARRLEMGRAAAESVRAQFGQTEQIERLENFYEEVIQLFKA